MPSFIAVIRIVQYQKSLDQGSRNVCGPGDERLPCNYRQPSCEIAEEVPARVWGKDGNPIERATCERNPIGSSAMEIVLYTHYHARRIYHACSKIVCLRNHNTKLGIVNTNLQMGASNHGYSRRLLQRVQEMYARYRSMTQLTYMEPISAITSPCRDAPTHTSRYPYIRPAGPPFSRPLSKVLIPAIA